MPRYNYIALDTHGKETRGTIEVASQNEAIGRVKEMGLFPTKIVESEKPQEKAPQKKARTKAAGKKGLGFFLLPKIRGERRHDRRRGNVFLFLA